MSKLSEQIRAARVGGGRPLGFGAVAAPKRRDPRGLLIAAVGADAAGADVVIVAADLMEASAVQRSVEAAGDALLGLEPTSLTAERVTAAEEGGASFVIYRPEAATADALLSEKLEYVLRLPPEPLEESDLRAIGSLRPTLVIAAAVSDPLPVVNLLQLRKLVLNLGAPLAVLVTADASSGLLQALRDSGVTVLLLDAPTAEQVETLRERIGALPQRSRRRGEDTTPVIPSWGGDDDEDEVDDFPTAPARRPRARTE